MSTEAHHMLTQIGRSADKVAVYERMFPKLLVRDVHASTTIVLPKLGDSNKAQLLLGTQT